MIATETTEHEETLVMCSWNVERDGIDANGSRRRRDIALAELKKRKPRVIFQQEATYSMDDDEAGRKEIENELGLVCRVAPVTGDSRNPTAVSYDPQLFDLVNVIEWSTGLYKPMDIPVVRLRGTVKPLALASLHLCYWAPQERAVQAQRLTTLGEPGKNAILAGDFNSEELGNKRPSQPGDWGTDASLLAHRTVHVPGAPGEPGKRWIDTGPDDILTGTGVFADLALHAATNLDQPKATQATASLWRTDQGPRRRIDRALSTPNLLPALKKFEVVTTPEVVEASDHALLVWEYSLPKLVAALG
ncbi:endonuclease/exonuclease/phosphatase family protein [Streptomyces millisiae]|uniref:Endonuclease/exonuclease/phosphatase family protein n=1 Tax=Streptomyces millisiae TaxID=3075542 RepID=A0ABU2LWG2_9ACTN|nr:endonuclease/exonuclease/phosphatase family protein [Streptomyces sp. DSM 44918]MDT0321875.1 endonuclease/exonuclease/phosphatase family protein [Streptomyces sp. DSM 44918]